MSVNTDGLHIRCKRHVRTNKQFELKQEWHDLHFLVQRYHMCVCLVDIQFYGHIFT